MNATADQVLLQLYRVATYVTFTLIVLIHVNAIINS